MPASTSKRQAKRPFQPSITDYFSRGHDGSAVSTHSEPPRGSVSVPVLPAAVQASLLNVGMRVRKSVPEGYQTKRGSPASGGNPLAKGAATTTRSNPTQKPLFQRPRELAPFCGILKVGGYAVPESAYPPDIDDLPPLDKMELDEDGLPLASQESNNSITSTQPTSTTSLGKRPYEEDEEFDGADPVIFEDEAASSVSGYLSAAPAHDVMNDFVFSRPLAQPKTRRQFDMATHFKSPAGGQENDRLHRRPDSGEFEEASFLQPSDSVEHEMLMD
ncbi:MAG: hypothetical protein M1815_000876 [Lichina confinis]|nr:MAG: hypothetical protein M1815_000876 [Lichina confinis]